MSYPQIIVRNVVGGGSGAADTVKVYKNNSLVDSNAQKLNILSPALDAVFNTDRIDIDVASGGIAPGHLDRTYLEDTAGSVDLSNLSFTPLQFPAVGNNFESYWTPHPVTAEVGRHIQWPDGVKLKDWAQDSIAGTNTKDGSSSIFYRQYSTTGDNLGMGLISALNGTAAAFIKREMNPKIDMWFHILEARTAPRYHFGFVSNVTEADNTYDSNSDIMQNQSGIVLGKGAVGQTTWRFRRNNGSASFTDSATTYTIATGWHRVRITFTNSGVDCQLDNNSVETFTTVLPAASTLLGLVFVIGHETSSSELQTLRIPYVNFGYNYFTAPSL